MTIMKKFVAFELLFVLLIASFALIGLIDFNGGLTGGISWPAPKSSYSPPPMPPVQISYTASCVYNPSQDSSTLYFEYTTPAMQKGAVASLPPITKLNFCQNSKRRFNNCIITEGQKKTGSLSINPQNFMAGINNEIAKFWQTLDLPCQFGCDAKGKLCASSQQATQPGSVGTVAPAQQQDEKVEYRVRCQYVQGGAKLFMEYAKLPPTGAIVQLPQLSSDVKSGCKDGKTMRIAKCGKSGQQFYTPMRGKLSLAQAGIDTLKKFRDSIIDYQEFTCQGAMVCDKQKGFCSPPPSPWTQTQQAPSTQLTEYKAYCKLNIEKGFAELSLTYKEPKTGAEMPVPGLEYQVINNNCAGLQLSIIALCRGTFEPGSGKYAAKMNGLLSLKDTEPGKSTLKSFRNSMNYLQPVPCTAPFACVAGKCTKK